MAIRFDDPSYSPHTARLAARVRVALGAAATEEAIRRHLDSLAGQTPTYQDSYLAALAPSSPTHRADSRGDGPDATRVDAEAAAGRFKRATEQAWRTPTLGARADAAHAGGLAKAPDGSVPMDRARIEQLVSESGGSEEAAARFKLETEDAWRGTPPGSACKGDLR